MNAARAEMRSDGLEWRRHAAMLAHGSSSHTGLSLPKHNGTPAAAKLAKGFIPMLRSPTRRS
jgi:hypothetical protein